METTDAHLMRATLEGICFQTKDVMQSMQSDTGHPITALNVDGGMSTSDTFLKILTNVCCLPVGKLLKSQALATSSSPHIKSFFYLTLFYYTFFYKIAYFKLF